MLELFATIQELIKCNEGLYKGIVIASEYSKQFVDCISLDKCVAMGNYMYQATGECINVAPTNDTAYMPTKTADGLYACDAGKYLKFALNSET